MKCPSCNSENHIKATYCGKCGFKASLEKEGDYNVQIRNISIYFFLILAYIILLHFTNFCDNYVDLLLSDVFFAFIILIFFAINYDATIRLFKFRKIKPKVVLFLLIGAPLFALIVNFVANFFNQTVFNKSEYIYYNSFQSSPSPLLFSIISIAVFPAIFEEILFRGIVFNESLKITRLKSTILVTSVLFTIMHLSLISALWIFPIALVFGYLRAKYNNILYGMIGHFAYNASIVLIQLMFR